MKVHFRTNLDNYQKSCFPSNLDYPPRMGETVNVLPIYHKYYADQRLPTRLEVVDVTYTENGAVCELWYKETDVKAAKLSGVILF